MAVISTILTIVVSVAIIIMFGAQFILDCKSTFGEILPEIASDVRGEFEEIKKFLKKL